MRWAIYGAGAIGSLIGARLAESGQQVSLIARGPHLDALREKGVRIRSKLFGDFDCRIAAMDSPAAAGVVDVVVLAMKAHAIPEASRSIAPLLGPETAVITLQNGIPWWYFHGLEEQSGSQHLQSVDPGGVIAAHIDPRRVIGAVAYCAVQLVEPGVVEHRQNARFPLGELDGSQSARLPAIAEILSGAGLEVPTVSNIRQEIWVKVLGNAAFNPVSVLCRATLQELLESPPVTDLLRSMMDEVRAVAASLGVEIPITSEQRLNIVRNVGHHKTSMLQDFEAGRPTELEPLLGAVIEMAGRQAVPTPRLAAIYACTKLLLSGLEK